MRRIPKEKKREALAILGRPNIKIELCNYNEYLGVPVKYYKVMEDVVKPSLIEFMIIPVWRGIYQYEVALGKDTYSHHVRKNAVFHTPGADDILEIYNMLHVRYLAQKSMRQTGKSK